MGKLVQISVGSNDVNPGIGTRAGIDLDSVPSLELTSWMLQEPPEFRVRVRDYE